MIHSTLSTSFVIVNTNFHYRWYQFDNDSPVCPLNGVYFQPHSCRIRLSADLISFQSFLTLITGSGQKDRAHQVIRFAHGLPSLTVDFNIAARKHNLQLRERRQSVRRFARQNLHLQDWRQGQSMKRPPRLSILRCSCRIAITFTGKHQLMQRSPPSRVAPKPTTASQ